MAVPFYLQGSQTAGLLGDPQQSQTSYVPGQGMAPNSAQPMGLPDVVQGAMAGGRIDYPMLQRMGYSPEQIDQMASSFNAQNTDINDQSSISTYPGQQPGAAAPTGMDGQGTVIGQDSAWMSPDELGAQTDALGSNLWSGQSADGQAGAPAGGMSADSLLGSGGGGGQNNPLSGMNITGGQTQGVSPNFGSLPNAQGGQVPAGLSAPNQAPMGNQQFDMTQPNAQDALSQYYQTPGYQLTEGQGAVDRFQTSPGYQFAMDQAMGQVNRNASARGLLGSGAMLKALSDRAQQMANQEYGNWQNRQQQMFGNYQNRLAGLAAGPTGADYAFNTGQAMGQGAMQTGGDVASLLAGQGAAGFSGILGSGAAQAGNINQAGANQAQILAGNQATRLATAAQGLF